MTPPLLLPALLLAAAPIAWAGSPSETLALKPARVWTGGAENSALPGWVVLVQGGKIANAGPAQTIDIPADSRVIDLPNCTLLPGLIDAHTHVLLHPYDETSWEDQVLKEPQALRVCRAVNHLEAILHSGFTTIRDLGTEGAGYADVGLKQAVEERIITGPRMIVTTKAIVATGSYAPRGFAPEFNIPQGAEEADAGNLVRVVRDQIGRGADWIKVYADNWDPTRGGAPTFSIDELKLIVETAASAGRPVAAHAMTAEGMRRATLAGVATIEHGDGGTPEVFRLMAEHKIPLGPTLAAAEANARYRGWNPATDPEPPALAAKKASFQAALAAGVTIINASDMGVFAHGQGTREIELMVEWGMNPADALRAATSTAARVLRLENTLGEIRPAMAADLIAVEGDPTQDISTLKRVRFVMKSGQSIVPDHP